MNTINGRAKSGSVDGIQGSVPACCTQDKTPVLQIHFFQLDYYRIKCFVLVIKWKFSSASLLNISSKLEMHVCGEKGLQNKRTLNV